MDTQFQQVDFGPLRQFLDNDDVTDISYSNNGQVWLKTLSKGVFRVENTGIDNTLVEKIAFQCANTMGKSFNMANPFLDAESAELRLNFVHDSIAKNGVAMLVRKTPAKIRLVKDQIIKDDYISDILLSSYSDESHSCYYSYSDTEYSGLLLFVCNIFSLFEKYYLRFQSHEVH